MSFRLFTRTGCTSCEEVKTFLENSDIQFIHINLDEENVAEANFVKIVPALFKENRLMAYGSDIVTYLSTRSDVLRSA